MSSFYRICNSNESGRNFRVSLLGVELFKVLIFNGFYFLGLWWFLIVDVVVIGGACVCA